MVLFIKVARCNFWQSLKKIMWGGFRATLNFQKFKIALNPLHIIFLSFAKKLHFTILDKKIGVNEVIFEL